jgi:hypothetical protein
MNKLELERDCCGLFNGRLTVLAFAWRDEKNEKPRRIDCDPTDIRNDYLSNKTFKISPITN